jgi:uncharacterized protein with FMN-binding domain
MKRVFTAITLTVAGLAALLGFKTRDLSASPGTTETAAESTTTTSTGATTSTAVGATTTTTAVATGTIKTDGPVVRIPFGPVQVSVVVTDGVLVDVVALQLPGGNEESNQINAYAAPRLREMALQAQSARIDVVSGATFTSRAYAESLQGALDAAGF